MDYIVDILCINGYIVFSTDEIYASEKPRDNFITKFIPTFNAKWRNLYCTWRLKAVLHTRHADQILIYTGHANKILMYPGHADKILIFTGHADKMASEIQYEM